MISNPSDIILEAKGISKYFGTITALESANLSLRPGEVLGVVGDNGAGKSTLMKVLSGLFKQSAGSIFFEGKKSRVLKSSRFSKFRHRNGLSRSCFG